jgi:hypothetical protein
MFFIPSTFNLAPKINNKKGAQILWANHIADLA